MSYARTQVQQHRVATMAASASDIVDFYLPRASRIKRYFAVANVAEAAHATQVLDATFVNKGTDGLGSATLAVLTNDSDLADSTTRESGAWVAFDAKELNTEDRPGGTFATDNADEIAAGSVISCTIAKAAGTATGDVTVGIEYIESD